MDSPNPGVLLKGPRRVRREGILPSWYFCNLCVLLYPPPQLSQAGDLIMEVYIEQQLPDNCVTLKVSL